MWRYCATALLVLTSALRVWGQDTKDKPILALDAGGHTAPIRGLAFTPDGKELISFAGDSTIRFWNVATGTLSRVVRLPVYGYQNGRMALSPNGQLLAMSMASADKEFGIALMTLPEDGTLRFFTGHTEDVFCLEFSSNGKRLASGSRDGTARIWDVASGRAEQTLRGHRSAVTGVAFSPDGNRLATSSADGTGKIWSVIDGMEIATLSPSSYMCGIAWSPDGTKLATGSLGNPLRIWSADGAFIERHSASRTSRSPIFTSDSKAVLVADGVGGRVFDLETKAVRSECPIQGEFAWTGALSPDNNLAATSGQGGEDLYVWNTKTGRVVHHLAGAGASPRGAAWSPDGKSIGWGIRAAEVFDYFKPGCLTVRHPLERTFDLSELEMGPAPTTEFRRGQFTSGTLSVEHEFTNNGRSTRGTMVVKDGDKELASIQQLWSTAYTFVAGERVAVAGSGLKLYRARTGELLRTFEGGAAHSIAPSPDNRYLLAPRGDQTLRIWRLDRDEPLLSFFAAGDNWILWTPEGYYAASPGGERLMGWQINNGTNKLATFYPAAQFRKSLYRPDVMKLLVSTGSIEQALGNAEKIRGKSNERTEVTEVLPPSVRLTSPERSQSIAVNTLEVRARASSVGKHPVTALQLLLEGRPAPLGLFRIEAPKLGDVEATWTITLKPGKQRLAVRAESAVSSALSQDVEVNYVAPDPNEALRLPSLYLLAVGISAYPGELKLNYAHKDAETLARTLKDHSAPLYEKVVVAELTDRAATRSAIITELSRLTKKATQRDLTIVFLAGHGEISGDGTFYFLPADVDTDNLEATAIPSDQIKKSLTNIPGKVVFMLDACHSAGVENAPKKRNTRSLTDDLIRDLVTDESGIITLCASTGRQFALESNEHRHGLFTLALVEGLRGKATKTPDGAVYLHHLDAYVTDRVKELSQGRQSPTTARPASIRSFPLTKP